MNDENIKKLRKEIDQLDDQLLDLFILSSNNFCFSKFL